MKKFALGFAAAAFAVTAAVAADFGTMPANYESSAESYISDRLADPRSARFQFVGEPYQVYADLAGYEGVACWAVDVRVKARLPGGGQGGYVPYTVLFIDGRPVAFEQDVRRLVKA